VLVVDDNADAAEMMHELLASAGHETALAFDAKAALEIAGNFKPDVALLDIGLPGMDGYELARRLRQEAGLGDLRLIAVTGYGQDQDQAQARAAGFDHHLVKPVGFEVLAPLLSGGSANRTHSTAR
jgi:CheY-like chemotaxis protein